MSLAADNPVSMESEGDGARRMVITRAVDAKPHHAHPQRGSDAEGFVQHPAIVRGLANLRGMPNSGGAAAMTLFSMPTLDVSWAHFKSGYPLPLHSHDVDCYYLVIAGSMALGSEVLGKGDGVLIPAGVPYTVNPGETGVEFIEMRTSPDYDTHYRARTDSYWDKMVETHRNRSAIWAEEKAPLGLL